MDHSHVIKNITGYNIVLDDDNVSIIFLLLMIRSFESSRKHSRFLPQDRTFIKSAIETRIRVVIQVIQAQRTVAPIQ